MKYVCTPFVQTTIKQKKRTYIFELYQTHNIIMHLSNKFKFEQNKKVEDEDDEEDEK